MFCVVASSYYDDFKVQEPECCNFTVSEAQLRGIQGSGQWVIQALHRLFGLYLEESKTTPMHSCFNFLGVANDTNEAFSCGIHLQKLKPGRAECIQTEIADILAAEECGSGRAASLRGSFGFAASQMSGKIGRGPLYALKDRQYHETRKDLHKHLVVSLAIMVALTVVAPPRSCRLWGRTQPPTRLYTDAASEVAWGDLTGGYLLCSPRLSAPIAGCAILPREKLTEDDDKYQLIGQGEMYMPMVALYNHPEIFKDADVLIFIDNISALIGCIKGTSRVADSSALAGLIHILLAAFGTRAHFEWVPSDSNPSDGVSRYGHNDPLAHALGCTLVEACLPPWPPSVQGLQECMKDVLCDS